MSYSTDSKIIDAKQTTESISHITTIVLFLFIIISNRMSKNYIPVCTIHCETV